MAVSGEARARRGTLYPALFRGARAPALALGRVLLSLGIVVAVWAAVSASGAFPDAVFPSPGSVWDAARELYDDGLLLPDLGISMGRAATGFALGAGLGVGVGLLTGRTRVFRALLNPFLTLLRPIPAIALVPVAIVWFGIGEGSKYFVIAYTVFLTVWFNTHNGMQYVPEVYIRASRSLGASRAREFFTVVVPAAAPHIVAGIRLGVALAFLSLVAAELTGASSGLGYRLQEARQYIRTDRMFAILIELGLVGALIDLLVGTVARRVVHWEGA